jgi:hypothetical protein
LSTNQCRSQLLIAPSREPRQAVLEDTLEMAKKYEHELQLRLLRVSMSQAGLVLKPHAKGPIGQDAAMAGYGSGAYGDPGSGFSPGEETMYGAGSSGKL